MPETAAFVDFMGHGRLSSKMASTSLWVSTMRLPEMRQAPSSLALLRTRRADQPRCFAKVSGVVTDGNIIGLPSYRALMVAS
jgi:hypothetical protein